MAQKNRQAQAWRASLTKDENSIASSLLAMAMAIRVDIDPKAFRFFAFGSVVNQATG